MQKVNFQLSVVTMTRLYFFSGGGGVTAPSNPQLLTLIVSPTSIKPLITVVYIDVPRCHKHPYGHRCCYMKHTHHASASHLKTHDTG